LRVVSCCEGTGCTCGWLVIKWVDYVWGGSMSSILLP
jgi:hypothetical protein